MTVIPMRSPKPRRRGKPPPAPPVGPIMPETSLTLQQTCAMLGDMKPRTFYDLRKTDATFPLSHTLRPGGHPHWRAGDVIEWMQHREQAAAPPRSSAPPADVSKKLNELERTLREVKTLLGHRDD